MAFITLEDRSGRQEVAIFSDLFNNVRDYLKKDTLIIVQGETKNDDYTGGLKVRALKIFDLTAARNTFAQKVILDIDAAQGLDHDFVSRLKATLLPYQPGSCAIEVNYKRDIASALIKLGPEWKVKPADDLIQALHNLAEGKITATIAYSQ